MLIRWLGGKEMWRCMEKKEGREGGEGGREGRRLTLLTKASWASVMRFSMP